MSTASARVAVVVWTYRRSAVLVDCLDALSVQTHQPERVVVADSASPDDTAEVMSRHFPQHGYVRLDDNQGMGAAINAALGAVDLESFDYVWFVEDDGQPEPEALAQLVDFLDTNGEYAAVSGRGANLHAGRWKWLPAGRVGPCDFCLLDGALVRSAVVDRIGGPAADFFIMQVDVEYMLRLHRAGWRSFQLGTVQIGARQLGAASPDRSWRAYYQTRNHLRMVLDLRSPTLAAGFAARTTRQLGGELVRGPVGRATAKLRLCGIRDAARRRMGRTVEPPGTPPRRTEPAHQPPQ